MTLADRLRAALERGGRGTALLLEGDALDEGGPRTPAAVLVPVVDRPEPTVILTERPMTMRRHPGQISFPGGRIEPGESPVSAALREAQEEIGLPPDRVDLIGIADPYVTITGFEIIPVIGVVPPDLALSPHPGEVADMFEAPLHFLLDPARQRQRRTDYQGRERCYYEILWGERRIWGATAAMIVNLGRRLSYQP